MGASLADGCDLQVHGEQFLMANLVLHQERSLDTLAITAAPCGHCRQFYSELACAVSAGGGCLQPQATAVPSAVPSLLWAEGSRGRGGLSSQDHVLLPGGDNRSGGLRLHWHTTGISQLSQQADSRLPEYFQHLIRLCCCSSWLVMVPCTSVLDAGCCSFCVWLPRAPPARGVQPQAAASSQVDKMIPLQTAVDESLSSTACCARLLLHSAQSCVL